MYYSFRCDCGYDATLAQSVERFTRNEKVAGSIPAGGLNLKVRKVSGCLALRTLYIY